MTTKYMKVQRNCKMMSKNACFFFVSALKLKSPPPFGGLFLGDGAMAFGCGVVQRAIARWFMTCFFILRLHSEMSVSERGVIFFRRKDGIVCRFFPPKEMYNIFIKIVASKG